MQVKHDVSNISLIDLHGKKEKIAQVKKEVTGHIKENKEDYAPFIHGSFEELLKIMQKTNRGRENRDKKQK